MIWITPYSLDTDFSWPLVFEDKVRIFYERIVGWQLNVAQACINGMLACDGTQTGPVPRSGYAVLQIVLSYFEMIAKMKQGYASSGQSERHFRMGVRDVFPQLRGYDRGVVDDLLVILYRSGRCGLYHGGLTGGRIMIVGEDAPALTYDPEAQYLAINPQRLVPTLREHLEAYVKALESPDNTRLRRNFERRFDYLMETDPLESEVA
jgi:hypothetical protein